MKQKVGNIKNSKDITATQIGTGDSEQEIGAISESERLQIRQIAADDETLVEALVLGLDITRRLGQLSDQDKSDLMRDSLQFMERTIGQPLETGIIKKSLREVQSQPGVPGALREVFRDLSVVLSAVSGTLAISQLTDATAITVGIPAVLSMTGFLASSKLREIYMWISRRLKALLT